MNTEFFHDKAVDSGLIPDVLMRMLIRRELRDRLRLETDEYTPKAKQMRLTELAKMPVTIMPELANEQHYEVPPAFYEYVLGPNLKYSCGLRTTENTSLAQLETDMLHLTCERADIQSGQHILELGCGWGAVTFWMAEHYPDVKITCVSNSEDQVAFIKKKAKQKKLTNITPVKAEISQFETPEKYDRIVSVEMFEHLRNYPEMLKRINTWLNDTGKLFIHIFTHDALLYLFERKESNSWMARHFFSGGIMPCFDIFEHTGSVLRPEKRWKISGLHYHHTCEAWLDNLDRHKAEILPILASSAPDVSPDAMFNRWRVFFMACSELFRYNNGKEWYVGHYLLSRRV